MNVTVTYVRWQKDEPREGRIFPSLDEIHPASTDECLVCGHLLGGSGPVQIFALGPEDEGEREMHVAGQWYTARALLLHAACLNGEVPEGGAS